MDPRPLSARLARSLLMPGLLGLVTVLSTGCYRYTPVRTGPIPTGQEVRVHLTAAGRERVDEILPPGRRWVDGIVVSRDGEGLVVRVSIPTDPTAPRSRALQQTVPFAGDEVAEVESRELDRIRTGAVMGMAVAAAAVILKLVLTGESGDTGGPGGNGSTDALIPALPPGG